jgi:hypothetical protein
MGTDATTGRKTWRCWAATGTCPGMPGPRRVCGSARCVAARFCLSAARGPTPRARVAAAPVLPARPLPRSGSSAVPPWPALAARCWACCPIMCDRQATVLPCRIESCHAQPSSYEVHASLEKPEGHRHGLRTGSGPPFPPARPGYRLIAQVRDTRESGRGQPHSKTLARFSARCLFRKVLECGCPLPLLSRLPMQSATTTVFRRTARRSGGSCFRRR